MRATRGVSGLEWGPLRVEALCQIGSQCTGIRISPRVAHVVRHGFVHAVAHAKHLRPYGDQVVARRKACWVHRAQCTGPLTTHHHCIGSTNAGLLITRGHAKDLTSSIQF